ncbi:class I adenylate-forming enzyme family protein [Desulfomonile tiedjei]|uniref:Acyl-CoA synthetase (AMP-forming)/AMP-acid ligase II n=1 Tax=Desulfomonile tiedjei (strain ATCC 49306 / DSM 6799 / DCB-1) TaxID=706587 RepID=I4CEL8_DESTA|nr:AMP-binding protein [Desulfomonile tiedjei]AFM28009.1 acyl-CoA synthetase (AMP-forming)/AMP-acid ligase II [Desulfomonile tiedjei DSM 6799]
MTLPSGTIVVGEALREAARVMTDRVAYVYEGRDISFREMDEISDRVAAGLLMLGFRKGDRLGVIGLNQPEWLYAYFAAAKIGVIVVGLSVRYRESELQFILNQSGTRGLVTIAALGDQMDYVRFLDEFRNKVPRVSDFIFVGGGGFQGSHSFEALMQTEVDLPALNKAKAQVQPSDPAMIIYTSGTTGRPKGAVLTHESMLAAALAEAEHLQVDEHDILQMAMPLNHVGGITCCILTMLLGKGLIELVPVFNPNQMIEMFEAHPPTLIIGVPTMHTLLLMKEEMGCAPVEKVRVVITGGSNADPNLLTKLREVYRNATVMNLYGLSETSGAVVMSPWDSDFDSTVHSIGKPMGMIQVKVVDVNGTDVPGGEVGELLFKGRMAAAGYFGQPEETGATFDADGWVHTGDLGYLDERGYIYLKGRLKEMFVQGGYNVYPVEVENVISSHPKVGMVAGIGVPDAVMGEIGRYYVVPKPNEELLPEEIVSFCKEHVADYKVPKQVVVCRELPLTPAGKVMKSKLKEDFEKNGI